MASKKDVITSKKRNIIVFVCDQLRPDYIGPYGSTFVPTPNMDRLAQNGVVFDHAITQSPVCGPARACMMTGRYVSDHKVWTNNIPFREGLDYIAEMMNDAGYRTACFGKMHHMPALDLKGFQHHALFEEGRLGDNEPYLDFLSGQGINRDRGVFQNPKNVSDHRQGVPNDLPEELHYEHWITSESISYLDKTQNEDKPFLLWVSYQGPHHPVTPPPEIYGSCDPDKMPLPNRREIDDQSQIHLNRKVFLGYDTPAYDIEMKKACAHYGDLIVGIDMQMGRLLNYLEASDQFKNTTIIFTADHGEMLGDFGLFEKGPMPYTPQLEIPLIISNHPSLKPASRQKQLCGNIDIPGTLLDIAQTSQKIGVSRSLIEFALDPSSNNREVMFSEFCDTMKLVYDGKFKYCYYPFSGESELYDLDTDPMEHNNLAGLKEFCNIENKLLKNIMEHIIVAKGYRSEAWDLTPRIQENLKQVHPYYDKKGEIPKAINLTKEGKENLKRKGMPFEYA